MSSSAAKIAANRKNATKSTGPKTLAGKRASALNATRHAVLSAVVVVPSVERTKDWEAHRDATIASLAPVGYLEISLADRVASLLWRLRRVIRYETENIVSALETAETERKRNNGIFGSPYKWDGEGTVPVGSVPSEIRDELDDRKDVARAFAVLSDTSDEDAIPLDVAVEVLCAVARYAGVALKEPPVAFTFLPPEAGKWHEWTGWTKKLVLQATTVIAVASKKEAIQKSGSDLWRVCATRSDADVTAAEAVLSLAEQDLRRDVRGRLLLNEDDLENLARYEAHLERSLYRALHELQRLEAARNGTGGAPLAVDVDVSAAPSRRAAQALDTTGETLEE